MTQTSLPTISEPTEDLSTAQSKPKARRKILGESSRPRPPPDPQNPQDVFTVPSAPPIPRPNARMEIYVDDPNSAPVETETAPWPDIGTRKSRVKENLVEVSKAAGTTLRQAGKSRRDVAGRAPKMAVYRDPEGGDHLDETVSPTTPDAS